MSMLVACGGGRDVSSSNASAPSSGDSQGIIRVLSNRPDLVSEGDVLVELVPQGETKTFRLTLNGQEISEQVVLRENGRIMGLVSGLQLGENTLAVSGPMGAENLTITNHPNHGPIFSAGQHRLSDWETCAAGGMSEHDDCNRAPE